jgi:hypothetical protein
MPDTSLVHNLEGSNEIAEQTKAWERMPNEPILWYKRFQGYYLLGPKRSLQHALEFSGEDIKVLKGTKNEASEGKNSKKTNNKLEVVKSSVPGSWKRASVTWHWQERAHAWDEHIIEDNAERVYERVYSADKYLLACDRIDQFAFLYDLARSQLKNTTPDGLQKYLARMESLLKSIREESKLIDEVLTRHVLASRFRKKYNDQTLSEYLSMFGLAADAELKKRGLDTKK